MSVSRHSKVEGWCEETKVSSRRSSGQLEELSVALWLTYSVSEGVGDEESCSCASSASSGQLEYRNGLLSQCIIEKLLVS